MAPVRYFIKMMAVVAISGMVAAQDAAAPKTVEFDGFTWIVDAREASVEQYRGREALKLGGGRAAADALDFSDGVISFDVAFEERTVFAGAGWRQGRPGHGEYWYLRGHLSGKPDSMQYTPLENGLSAWQIFSDRNALAAATHDFMGWNTVRIVVKGDKVDIYYNSDEPVLHVPDLKTDAASGLVWLNATGRGGAKAYFSNVRVRPLGAGDRIVGKPAEPKPVPEGILSTWQMSNPVAEEQVKDQLTLPSGLLDGLTFQPIEVETNGIANLAKLANRSDGDTVIIRQTINSPSEGMRKLTFGYSDRVRIYLNGKRVFAGNAGWRVQDYRFLGTVGFYDSIGLDLKEGSNDLVVAVSETFGGWAWAGAFSE